MIKGVISTLFALTALIASAQTSNVEQEFRQKLERASSENSTISCTFTQTQKVRNVKQSVQSSGQFFYDNRGSMALIYTQPKGDKVIINGDTFTVVVNGKKFTTEASSNPMMAQISFMMQACMSGDVSKLGRGWGMSVAKNEENYEVRLTPNDKRVTKYISGMTLRFDKVSLTLNELRIDQSGGGYTNYQFKNKKLNQSIDGSYFKIE